jgi:hypothetical protein
MRKIEWHVFCPSCQGLIRGLEDEDVRSKVDLHRCPQKAVAPAIPKDFPINYGGTIMTVEQTAAGMAALKKYGLA